MIIVALCSCNNEIPTEKQVPVYEGMTVSSTAEVADNGFGNFELFSHKGHGDEHDNKPEGCDHYADLSEDIYIHIHIKNPDKFEILSFTFNGEKYSNYMFEYGSNMETIIVKYNVGRESGIHDYTIDAIKYVDGTDIKDVIIRGDQTISVHVSEYESSANCKHNDPSKIEILPAKEATCQETGLTEGKYCNACEQVIEVQKTTPKADHIVDELFIEIEATKTEAGFGYYYCTVCGTRQEMIIPATGPIDWAYTVNSDNKSCTLTGIGTHADVEVIIPKYIGTYKVTAIGEKAFADCSSVTSIQIPDTVTSIGTRAFYGCTGLTEITIPASVTDIGSQIFYKADNLNTVYYNSSYSSSENPFLSVPSIKKVVLGCDNINSYLLKNCTNIQEIEMLDSVTSIYEKAFFGCASLTSVTIPDSVTFIGWSAFEGCSSLASVTISTSVTSIDHYTFKGCTSLESVTLPNSVTNIGGYVFEGCTSLVSITIPDSVTSISTHLFWNCTSLENVIIGNSVTSIGNSAFQGCTSLVSIIIPDSVTSIGDYAFGECSSLTSIEIPDSVTSIDRAAFAYCSSLESVTIPDSVTSIGEFAFEYCSSLKNITIPSSVTNITNYTFIGCASLTSVTIPDSVTSIGYGAFHNCTSLTSVTIPDSVTSIGDSAFGDCTSLTSVTIPDFVTSIGDSAFRGCTSLTSIEIPDSVASIDEYALYNCPSLTSIYYEGTMAQWNAIEKGYDWDGYTGDYIVYSTDGTISK